MAKSVTLILSQAEVNREILQIIVDAKTTLTLISMMSQLSDPELVDALNNATARGISVRIYHSINPYVSNKNANEGSASIQVPVCSIPMHGKQVPSFISVMLKGIYIKPFFRNVTHTRCIVNDTHVMFGGVDFNRVCEAQNYIQHAVKIKLSAEGRSSPSSSFDIVRDHMERLVLELRTKGHLYHYTPPKLSPTSSPSAIISTSSVDTSAYQAITSMISQAQHHIFIENQYFEHEDVLSTISKQQALNPLLKVTLVGNYQFDINPYHPGQAFTVCGISRLGNYALWKETKKGLSFLRDKGCEFEFRTYRNKYTHNKIFIVDRGRYVAMGTFNLHRRSLDAGYDCEIGVLMDTSSSIRISSSTCSSTIEEKKGEDHYDEEGSNTCSESIRKMASEYIESVLEQTQVMTNYSTKKQTQKEDRHDKAT